MTNTSNTRTLLRLTCVCVVLTIQVAAHLRWPVDSSWRRAATSTSFAELLRNKQSLPPQRPPRLLSSSSSLLDKRQVSESIADNAIIIPAVTSIEAAFNRLQRQLHEEIRAVFGGLLPFHSMANTPRAVTSQSALGGRSHASTALVASAATELPAVDGSRMACSDPEDNDAEENMVVTTSNSKRAMSPLAFVSDCDCREKVGLIELGWDHYPSILSGNWTCKQRCSNGRSGQCLPMLYNVHVLQRTSVPSELKKGERQIMVPEELSSCWRFRTVTVVTDCLCVPGM